MNWMVLKKQTELNATIILNIAGSAILQGIAFMTIPIFTRVLGSEQYGLYAVFSSWVSIFSTFISFGLSFCIGSGRYFYKQEYYNFRNNIVFFATIVALCVMIACIIFYSTLYPIVLYDFRMYLFMLLTAVSSNIISMITSILIYEKKAVLNFALSVFLSLSTVILSLIIIYNFNFNNLYEGRVIGHCIPYALMALALNIYVFKTCSFSIDGKYFRYGIIVGGPVVFHQLSHFLLAQSDRVMMRKMGISNTDIGVYSLFYSFCGVTSIILNAFNSSFSPFYSDYIDEDNKTLLLSKSKNYLELYTVICIGFLLFSREVSYLMADSEYYIGIELIPLFVCSVYFMFMYQFAVNYEFYYRRTKTIAIGTACAALLNIILNIYFIKAHGMYGAAIATIISYGALFLFHYIIAKNMEAKRFYFDFKFFFPGIIFMIVAVYLFYSLSGYVFIRWVLGIMIGVTELIIIIRRKSIF